MVHLLAAKAAIREDSLPHQDLYETCFLTRLYMTVLVLKFLLGGETYGDSYLLKERAAFCIIACVCLVSLALPLINCDVCF